LVAIVTVMLNVVLGVVPGQIVEVGDVALARAVGEIELNGCTQGLSLFLPLALKVSAFIRSMAIAICFDMGRHA
jgi:hypothetical protein